VGESVAEDLPDDAARGLRDATDALIRALDRYDVRFPRSSAGPSR
jgi:hypothetical protein